MTKEWDEEGIWRATCVTTADQANGHDTHTHKKEITDKHPFSFFFSSLHTIFHYLIFSSLSLSFFSLLLKHTKVK